LTLPAAAPGANPTRIAATTITSAVNRNTHASGCMPSTRGSQGGCHAGEQRFRQEGLGAGAILGSCVRGQRERRCRATAICRKPSDALHQIVAIHIRQANVADYDIDGAGGDARQRCRGRLCDHDVCSMATQKSIKKFQRIRFVFDHENTDSVQ
jgi:hypothetical protein